MGRGTTKEDFRTHDERDAARKAFELSMRQAVMEFDAFDTRLLYYAILVRKWRE